MPRAPTSSRFARRSGRGWGDNVADTYAKPGADTHKHTQRPLIRLSNLWCQAARRSAQRLERRREWQATARRGHAAEKKCDRDERNTRRAPAAPEVVDATRFFAKQFFASHALQRCNVKGHEGRAAGTHAVFCVWCRRLFGREHPLCAETPASPWSILVPVGQARIWHFARIVYAAIGRSLAHGTNSPESQLSAAGIVRGGSGT